MLAACSFACHIDLDGLTSSCRVVLLWLYVVVGMEFVAWVPESALSPYSATPWRPFCVPQAVSAERLM